MKRFARLLATMGAVGASLLAVTGTASAHPLGNFSVNHYAAVYVSAASVDVDLVVDLAELPTIEALRDIDSDGDRVLSAAEADAARGPLCACGRMISRCRSTANESAWRYGLPGCISSPVRVA